MRSGEIIVVRYRKALKIGAVREASGEKVKIGLDRSKTISVPRENVLLETGVVASTAGELDRFVAEVEAQASSLELREVWELLAEEGRSFSFEEIAELLDLAAGGGRERSALLWALESGSDPHFVPTEGRYRPLSAADLRAEEDRARRQAAEAAEDDSFRGWLAGREHTLTQETLTARQRGWLDRVRALIIEGDEWPQATKVRTFLEAGDVRAGSRRSLFQLLVRRGVFDAHEHLELARLAVPHDFSTDAENEAAEWDPARTRNEPFRRDFTALDVFSIDDEATTDIDDAFSLETLDGSWRVGIHITDLTRAVPRGSVLDREAAERATSHYFPERKIPMLPPALSAGTGSLREGEERPALSLFLRFDGDGTIVDREWLPSLVKSRHRLTYSRAEELIGREGDESGAESSESDGALREALRRLLSFAEACRERRLANGAVELDRADLEIRLDPDGEVRVELRTGDPNAQLVVSELMILYNVEAARYAFENDVPILYRGQQGIRPEARAEAERANHPALRRQIILRAASPSDWTATPAAHGFLGVDLYTQTSSPLRRYVDLVLQRQIASHLEHGEAVHGADDVRRILYETEERLRELRYLEVNRRQYWLLQYLKSHIGETFEAVVLENAERYAFVEITALALRVPANLSPSSRPGESVRVRLAHADPFDLTLKFVEDR